MTETRTFAGVEMERIGTGVYSRELSSGDTLRLTHGDGRWFASVYNGPRATADGPVEAVRSLVSGAPYGYVDANPELLPAMANALYWGDAAQNRARAEAAEMRERLAAGCGYCGLCCSVVQSPGDWLCEACEMPEGE